MTAKDLLITVLCTYGYSQKIEIDVTNLGDEGILYEMSATNPRTGDEFSDDANGFMFALHIVLRYMRENDIQLCSDWDDMPVKSVLNEKERESRYKCAIEQELKK